MTHIKRFPSKISGKQAQQALLRSGYLLESRLDTILRNRGFYVDANHAYPDPDTGKSRELDLYAMSAHRAGPNDFDWIFAVLLIECVNNPQPLTLITKEPQLPFLHHHEVKLSGLPVKVRSATSGRSWESLPDYFEMNKYHHYCKGRIATQFCSFTQKKGTTEWMAVHETAHFDAFQKLCSAVEYFVGSHFTNWRFNGREFVNIEFYYPLVVLQGDLIDARPTRRSVKLKKAKHLQYRRSAMVNNEAIDYQIDMVTEALFPKYLEMVEQEMAKTARLIRRRGKIIRNAIDAIARRARRLRSPEKIREAMEF